jgi:hypothetical protein
VPPLRAETRAPWRSTAMSADLIAAEHRFAPNDAYLQVWWFRAYPEPTTAGFVRFDAPSDIAFESWIDGPEAEATQGAIWSSTPCATTCFTCAAAIG